MRLFLKIFLSLQVLLGVALSNVALSYEETTFIHYDSIGNARVSINDSTATSSKRKYQPFGEVQDSEESKEGNYFQGASYNPSVDSIIPMGSRFYYPEAKIFLTRDKFTPLNCHNCYNPYQYAYNNPIHFQDVNGDIPLETLSDAGFVIYDIGKITVGVLTDNPVLINGGLKDLAYDSFALVTPYVPAGLNRLTDVSEITTKALRRPYLRVATRKAIEAGARMKNGKFIDINLGTAIKGKFQYGHITGAEHRRLKAWAENKNLTQKEFNDFVNNPKLFQIEDPASNMSGKFELPGKSPFNENLLK